MEKVLPLVISEEMSRLPVLIVDKKGFIGEKLVRILREKALVVYVSAEEVEYHDNVIHIPYRKRIPVIPDNKYSHIYVVYNGEKEIIDMLSSFVSKVEESLARLLFISSIGDSSFLLFKHLLKHQTPRMQIYLYGETFAERNGGVNPVNNLIHEAKIYGRMEIPNSGLENTYPVHIDDVISNIVERSFLEDRTFKLYYLFPSHPISQMSLARMIQQQNPLIKLDFKKHKKNRKTYYIPSGGIFLFLNYNLESHLSRFNFQQVETIPLLASRRKRTHISDPEVGKRRLTIFLTLLFSLFIAPIFVTFCFALFGAGMVALSLKQAESTDIVGAQRTARLASHAFTITETLVPSLVLPNTLLPQQTLQFLQNIRTGKEVVVLEEETLSAALLIINIYEKKSDNPKEDFLKSIAILKNSLLTFQKLKAEGKLPQQVGEKHQKYSGILQLAEGTIDMWPELLGFDGKKQYLLLFQNNMELRPGGGFIGSYGVTSVENGVFEKLQVFDVYDADGKLKEHIDAPFGLRRYLGATHWYLRDSNFNVDFAKNAEQARLFLKLETGQNIDGVVALDTTFLKYLLSTVGSVNVSDYNETVTPDNFYLITQTYAEKDFFPGSTQKKDFLRSLMNALQVSILEERKHNYGMLVQVVERAIREKHLLFASADTAQQNIFSVNGLSSSLIDSRTSGENGFLDLFSVIDANVGANKANYYVKRAYHHKLRFDDAGSIQASVDIQYTNASTKESPFGGEYKNYMRLLLPKGAQLQSVFIDGVEQETVPAITDQDIFTLRSFIPPAGLEIENSELLGKTIYGFFVSIPLQSTKTITVNYRIADALNTQASAFHYKLLLYKQPGTENNPYTLTFSYPPDYQIVNATKDIVDLGGKFTYETDIKTDKNVNVSFSKK